MFNSSTPYVVIKNKLNNAGFRKYIFNTEPNQQEKKLD